jgi:hypothetical protein
VKQLGAVLPFWAPFGPACPRRPRERLLKDKKIKRLKD